jgi:hypothetical protein
VCASGEWGGMVAFASEQELKGARARAPQQQDAALQQVSGLGFGSLKLAAGCSFAQPLSQGRQAAVHATSEDLLFHAAARVLFALLRHTHTPSLHLRGCSL